MRSSYARRVIALCALLAVAILAMSTGMAEANNRGKGKKARDRNHDGIADRWERKYRLSTKKNQANRDQDHDGVRNKCEFQAKSHPRSKDSDRDGDGDYDEDRDRDGLTNGEESELRTNCGRKDSDRDGTDDGEELFGTILSFENNMLTIETLDEELITAEVAEDAVIRCVQHDEDRWDHDQDEEADTDNDGTAANYGDDEPNDDESSDDSEGRDCPVDALQPGRKVAEAIIEDGYFLKIKVFTGAAE